MTRLYVVPYSSGFSLVELLLVVAIIGILAGIALPNYTKAREHALGREAIANLKIIAAAERILKLETGAYKRCGCWNSGTGGSSISNAGCNHPTLGCNKVLSLDLSAENWGYIVYEHDVSGWVATAFRQGLDPLSPGTCAYEIVFDPPGSEPVGRSVCP